MGWNINWYRTRSGNEETGFVTISDIKAEILEDPIIKCQISNDNIVLAKITDESIKLKISKE
jgi:hypothetical protein